MRFKNEDKDLKLYAVAGTQTVLLAFHLNKSLVNGKDFIGFDIVRESADGTKKSLNGSKRFKSLQLNAAITDPAIKNRSLVQSYFWKDYTADPNQTYTYVVSAMFGTALEPAPTYTSKIKVRTEELRKGKHSIFFNYGVTGSQGYARNPEYGNKPIDTLDPATRKKALDYLSRDLYNDGLMQFMAQVNSPKHSLYCAFFEIEYEGVLDKLVELRKLGKQGKVGNVEIVYSAQPGQNKEGGNTESLTKAGLLGPMTYPRTKASQPHNKFMVLCENGKPVQVWTGSTNLTMSGIFGQSNTGHWIDDSSIAKKYFTYWTTLKDNPKMGDLSVVSESIQPDVNLKKLPVGTHVFFSPRDLPFGKDDGTPPHLQAYADLIDSAKELVCMIFPFNYDEVFKTVYDKDKDYLRLLIFEKSSEAKEAKANADSDPDLLVTGGAVLEDEVANFIEEVTPKKTVKGGVLYVHNKFFLIDPLSDQPVVVTGSANFSKPSIISNDENSLLIKGDTRVADIYLTEFNRLFEHFLPRYLKKLKKSKEKGFDAPLDEKYKWFGDYYIKDSYHQRRGQLFIKMKKAVKG